MTGYDQKKLTLSHDAKGPVEFIVEVDFYADGQWYSYQRVIVEPDKQFTHEFANGYSAHWLRVTANTDCRADAQLIYR
jgi:hypothetical protein